MANQLFFCDSFSHYATGDITRKWTQLGGASIFPTAGRSGGGAVAVVAYGPSFTIPGTAASTSGPFGCATLAVGVAVKAGGAGPIVSFTSPFGVEASLSNNWDGTLSITLGGYTVATSAPVFSLNTWYYVEFCYQVQYIVDQLLWNFWVYLMPPPFLTAHNLVLPVSRVPGAIGLPIYVPNQVQLRSAGGGYNSLFCDFYLTGSTNPLFGSDTPLTFGNVGNVTVGAIRPRADSGVNGWTPNISGPHYAMVDDGVPDFDATILTDGGVGSEDLHYMQPIPGNAIVYGIQSLLCAQKSGVGSATVAPVYREGSTDYVGATQYPSVAKVDESGWWYQREALLESVATGGAWTAPEINSLMFGPRRIS
jgi:hypothetical protein